VILPGVRRTVCIAAVAAGLVAAASAVATASPTRGSAFHRNQAGWFSHLLCVKSGPHTTLGHIFSAASTFKWYSSGGPSGRLGADAYQRSTLLPYFADRHVWGEHLKLTSYTGHGNATDTPTLSFQLVREARDVVATTYDGKGAISAQTGATKSPSGRWRPGSSSTAVIGEREARRATSSVSV